MDDYHLHLRAIEALFKNPRTKKLTDVTIKKILLDSETDIGIRWDNGQFLPSGSPLLDEKLVNDALGFMTSRGYDGVLIPFQKGLDHFLHSVKNPERLADVITDMYEALEALAKIITDRDKDLSGNAQLFISKSNVSEEYKPILKAYIAYANEFRHAAEKGQKKATPSRAEVESFIYFTGLFVRLAMMSPLSLGAKLVPKHPDTPRPMVRYDITNPCLFLMMVLAVCPEVGRRRDS